MTDVRTLIHDVTDKLKAMLPAFSPVPAEAREFAPDPRTAVSEWPPAATHLNFPQCVSRSVIGQTMGPMIPPTGVKDPVYFTVVQVDGNRVGLAYGELKLEGAE